jgi:hypothetical protein
MLWLSEYAVKIWLIPDFSSGGALVSGCPSQTRSLRSCGFIRSRSASELLLAQKTKLPRLTTVCSGQPNTVSNDVSELILFYSPGALLQKFYKFSNILLLMIYYKIITERKTIE